MDPIVFIDGYASSDPNNNVGDPADTMFLDVGGAQTTAMIEVRLPPDAGSVPHIQFAHGIVLKLLNSDARRQGLDDGTIELWDGHSEVSLESELRKSSNADDSVCGHSRAKESTMPDPVNTLKQTSNALLVAQTDLDPKQTDLPAEEASTMLSEARRIIERVISHSHGPEELPPAPVPEIPDPKTD